MKALYILLLFAALVSCHKKHSITPHHNISLQVDGNTEAIPVEYIDAGWDYKTGTLNIYAEGINHELLKLHLGGVHDTATISNIGKDNVYYSDDIEFFASAPVNGYISVSSVCPQYISGSVRVTLGNSNDRTDTKTVLCSFTIYSEEGE